MKRRSLFLGTALLAASGTAHAQIVQPAGGGASNGVASAVTQSGVWTLTLPNGSHLALDAGGNVIGAVTQSGGPWTVTDSRLPASGSGTDASNAAPAALTLLQTLTVANPGAYRIQNQSAATVQFQLCPSTATASAPTGCTTYLLAPGTGANAQGADSSPEVPWFTGLIFVRGASGAQVAARGN